jgi:hypothetical protein
MSRSPGAAGDDHPDTNPPDGVGDPSRAVFFDAERMTLTLGDNATGDAKRLKSSHRVQHREV